MTASFHGGAYITRTQVAQGNLYSGSTHDFLVILLRSISRRFPPFVPGNGWSELPSIPLVRFGGQEPLQRRVGGLISLPFLDPLLCPRYFLSSLSPRLLSVVIEPDPHDPPRSYWIPTLPRAEARLKLLSLHPEAILLLFLNGPFYDRRLRGTRTRVKTDAARDNRTGLVDFAPRLRSQRGGGENGGGCRRGGTVPIL